MKIIGKSIGEYFAFQRVIMALILIVGFVRLGLSLAGFPTSTVKWISLTGLAVVGIVYCAIEVPRTGFGGYKHLLPLYLMQAGLGNIIIAGGIVLSAITGTPNIYSAPEYSAVANPWMHALGHLIDGFIAGPLLGFIIGAPIMFIAKKVWPVRQEFFPARTVQNP
jgi:hypothetical protein